MRFFVFNTFYGFFSLLVAALNCHID